MAAYKPTGMTDYTETKLRSTYRQRHGKIWTGTRKEIEDIWLYYRDKSSLNRHESTADHMHRLITARETV